MLLGAMFIEISLIFLNLGIIFYNTIFFFGGRAGGAQGRA